jgi:hypothetical protein
VGLVRGDEDDVAAAGNGARHLQAGLAWHADIQEGQVGAQGGDHGQCFLSVACLADQLECRPGLLQPCAQLVAHQPFVIGQYRSRSAGHAGSRW